jgi:hypothetical protein
MKNISYVLLAVGIVLVWGMICIAQDITVEPEEILFSLADGAVSGQITIFNNTDKKITIQILLEDMVFQSGDENTWRFSQWTTIEPSETQISPNDRGSINYRIDVPIGVEGPHWARLRFIEIAQTVEGEDVYRSLAPICFMGQVDQNNLVHGALLGRPNLLENQENQKFFILPVQKLGTDFNRYTGKITIISPSHGMDDPVGVIMIPEFLVLPFSIGELSVLCDIELSPGIYQAVVEISLDNELKISTIWPFWI